MVYVWRVVEQESETLERFVTSKCDKDVPPEANAVG